MANPILQKLKVEENWKFIPAFDDRYMVSDLGRIMAVGRGMGRTAGKILKPWGLGNQFGYPTVYLCKNNRRYAYRVHKIVATLFVPNPRKYPNINHLNFNKDDSRAVNLKWCTQKENIRHSFAGGRYKERDARRKK